jgi:very-short-patch-repair endonuclease
MIYSRIIANAKQSHGSGKSIILKARELRKNMTPAEEILWSNLKDKKISGLHFRRQHPYGMYILDFYCNKIDLAIEVDGKIHLSKIKYDKEREEYLKSSGVEVLRFKNEEIINNIDSVISRIKEYLKRRKETQEISR